MRRTLPELRSTWMAEWDKSNSVATFTGYTGRPRGRLFLLQRVTFHAKGLPNRRNSCQETRWAHCRRENSNSHRRSRWRHNELCIACDVATAQIARPWHKELRWQM